MLLLPFPTLASGPPPIGVKIDSSATHTPSRLYLGCHSDSGYTHQPRGFYSQLVFGESFEEVPGSYEPWLNVTSSGAIATASFSTTVAKQGSRSLNLSYTSGSGVVGMANRGLGREGLYLEGGKDYEGYLFARSLASRPQALVVGFRSTTGPSKGDWLAKTSVSVPAGAEWSQLSFKLTPSMGTACVDGSDDPDGVVMCGNVCGPPRCSPGHACVKCGGELVVGLEEAGAVFVDYIFVSPGAWGTVAGLPVLKSGVDALSKMGVSLIRQGGSFTDPADYFWKRWRGKPWDRPSVGWAWGQSLVSGW